MALDILFASFTMLITHLAYTSPKFRISIVFAFLNDRTKEKLKRILIHCFFFFVGGGGGGGAVKGVYYEPRESGESTSVQCGLTQMFKRGEYLYFT